ncbi:MAG: hypothetical protein IJH75_08020 [Mogibacterium sp.]|nr:hypothetical protein [Mogibacterium sp.]
MEIRQVLKDYDALFRHASPEEIHGFLAEKIGEAEAEGDAGALLTLLNEQIGYARDTDREAVAMDGSAKLRALLDAMGLEGTIPYANSLLNIANACRAYGRYEEAAELFPRIEAAYQDQLEEGAYEFAGLYNNWSLLAMAQHRTGEAVRLIRRAIGVIDRYDRAVIKQATSRVNLAHALMDLAKEAPAEDAGALEAEARESLEEAIRRFEEKDAKDYHYAAALAAMGDMKVRDGCLEEAAEYYDSAIALVRLYMGDNNNVRVLEEKKRCALAASGSPGGEGAVR